MLERIHYIYGWKNLITNTYFYIGAGRNANGKYYCRSYAKHYYKKPNRTHAQRKRDKLGENCLIEILADNLTLDERYEKEKEFIALYKRTIDGGTLCNHTEGGDINPMFDDKVREKHSSVMQSEEYKNLIGSIGKEVWAREGYRENYMKIYTEEFRNKMSLSQANRKELEYNGQVFQSKKALARFLGISSQALNYRLNNGIDPGKPM